MSEFPTYNIAGVATPVIYVRSQFFQNVPNVVVPAGSGNVPLFSLRNGKNAFGTGMTFTAVGAALSAFSLYGARSPLSDNNANPSLADYQLLVDFNQITAGSAYQPTNLSPEFYGIYGMTIGASGTPIPKGVSFSISMKVGTWYEIVGVGNQSVGTFSLSFCSETFS